MIFALLSGVLMLRFGAIAVILASIFLCAAALLGLAFASSLLTMTLLLTLLGGCAAMIWVPLAEVAQTIVPSQHQGKALGLMSSGTSYGVFCNSVLLGWPLVHMGWRGVWMGAGLLVTLLAILSIWRLRRFTPSAGRERAADGLARSLFARVKSLPRGLTGAVLLIMFLNGLSCMPYQNYLSAFLQGEAGYPHEFAAQMWRLIGLVGMGSGFAMGALADRITIRRGLVIAHMLLTAAGALVLLDTMGGTRVLPLLSALTFSLSFYPIFGLVPAYVSSMFRVGDAALVFSFGNVALGLGGILGNALGGWLKVATGSFTAIYLIIALAALISVVMSLLLPAERRPEHHTIASAA